MSPREKLAMANRLRSQAESIHRQGLTNFFAHTYACLRYGQASKERAEDRCGPCPMRQFVPGEFTQEAFPCQHIQEEGWEAAAQQPQLPEQYVDWLLRTASELEAEAAREQGSEELR